MTANAILDAIKSSTHEERMAALVELFKMEGLRPDKPLRISHEGHLSYVVPLVKNGRTTPLSPDVIEEMKRRFERRDEVLALDVVIAER